MQRGKTLFPDAAIRPKKPAKDSKHKKKLLSPSPHSNPFSNFKYCEKEASCKSSSPSSGKLPKLRAVSPSFDKTASQKRTNTVQCFPSHFVSLKIIPKNSVVRCHPARTPTFIDFDEVWVANNN